MKAHLHLLLPGFLFCALQTQAQDIASVGRQKPFAISGALDIRTIAYRSEGIAARRSPFSWVISGSPTISVYGISIPVSFTFSEQERSFAQPFNQFGLSPTYKWITVHGGYRNITFSPYTLAGHTMLGGGVELRPGKFRVGLMTGRLNRATTLDTTTGALRPYSFSRFGTAVRVGYGSETSHVDVSFLQAKDHEKNFKGNPDSVTVRPAANSVLGVGFKFGFLKNFQVFGDGGVSIYTRDSRSDLVMETDSSRKLLSGMISLFKVNGTSEYYLAYSSGVGYTSKYFSLKIMYKYADPGFKSMGAYYFQDDLRNITLNPSFNALKGKLRFTGSIGIQEDNLKKLKAATTRRIIGLASLSWEITDKLGVDANYTNYTSNAEPTVTLIENRYLLAQTNSNISVTPRLVMPGKTTTQVVLLSYNLSSLRDLNKDTLRAGNIRSQVAFLNHNLTWNKLGMTLMSGLNYTTNELSVGNFTNFSGMLGFSKTFLKNKLMVSSNNSYVLTKPVKGHGRIINLGGNVAYMPARGHRFSLRINSMDNRIERDDADPVRYSELTGELAYTFNF